MTTIYDELRDSHATQRRLCNSLVRTRAKNPTRRRGLLRELRIELAAHAAAEERYLYVPVLMHDLGLNSSRHALAEHHDLDERIDSLPALGRLLGADVARLPVSIRIVLESVLPLQLPPGVDWRTLGLKGDETVDVQLGESIEPQADATLVVIDAAGTRRELVVRLRIDTPIEADCYRDGGIPPLVLRRLTAA